MTIRFAALLAALALTACGGGGGAAATTPSAPGRTTSATAAIRLLVPAQSTTASANRRRSLFVAFTTAGLTVSAYTSPRAQHPTAIAQASFDVSATSPNCTTGANGRTCALALTLPATGTDDFVVTSYDTAPVSGTIPVAAKQLGVGTDAGVTIAGGSNALNFTLNGVVAGAAVQLPTPSLTALVNGTQTLNVQALDADQNTIVTDAYEDAQGNPVSIALAVTGAANALFGVAPASISVPTPNGVTLTYSGSTTLTSAEFKNGFAVSVNATPSNTGIATTSNLTAPASFGEFALNAAAPDEPAEITTGPDNALWFADGGPPNAIGRLTLAGAVTEITVPTGGSDPNGITTGPDNNIWFTEAVGQKIGVLNPATRTVTGEFAVPPSGGHSANPLNIVSGADGNLWFTECNVSMIAKINPTSHVISAFSTPTATAVPDHIVNGPDNNLWFTELNNNAVARSTTAGVITEFPIPTAGVVPFDITVGPDGALWFTEESTNAIGRITATGVVSQFPIAGMGSASGTDTITTGGDGNLWVSANGEIIRAVPNLVLGGTPAFTVFSNIGSGGPAAGMTKGPNGNVYLTDEDTPGIGWISL
jgi:streptogramin lyase